MRRVISAIGTMLSWIFLIALLAICLGPLIGSSIYLDRNGIVGPGVVTAKSEQIDPSDKSNRWLRRLDITVSYEPHDQINWLMGPLELGMYAVVLALIAGTGFISRAFVRRRKANRAVGRQP